MKNNYFFFGFLVLSILCGLSCHEVVPTFNVDDDDDPTGGQERQVLVEEFTGERCVHCPAGSAVLQSLVDEHKERLIAVSIHAGFQAVPYPESDNELAGEIGDEVLTVLGEPTGYPAAVINRHYFPGEDNFAVSSSTWPGYIEQELAKPAEMYVELESTYNDATKDVIVDVGLTVLETLEYEDVRLTVYITEDNIIDPQQTPGGVDYEYNHKHVLRGALTPVVGEILNEDLRAGSTIDRSFSYTLDSSWVTEECHIVAFVHRAGAELDVIQAHEIPVLE